MRVHRKADSPSPTGMPPSTFGSSQRLPFSANQRRAVLVGGAPAGAEPPAAIATTMPSSNQEPREGFIAVGRVLRPWGLRGDLKLESLTDFPERFDPGRRLWLAERERTVERSRSQAGALFVKFSDISDATDAERRRASVHLSTRPRPYHPEKVWPREWRRG